MRQSHLFTKTRKESPKDEESKNAQLLIRAGYIHKEMAGVYDMLPLGLRVLRKIEQIVREEMNKEDGQEVELSALQDPKLWKATDRWDDEKVDNWFKTKLKNDTELGLGFTHEEAITNILKDHVSSYNHLPKYVYQFQNKFRNELRSKSGIMRGREFLMKDLYSFSKDEEQHAEFYEKMKVAYMNVYERVGLGDRTYITFASGGVFSQFSHEFQTLSEVGEDTIYLDESKGIAVNEEVYTDEVLNQLELKKEELVEKKSIEVGNIFSLGTKFSKPLNLMFKDEKGEQHSVIMGSYGIGIGRIMGTVVEVLADEKGIVWPESIAPFQVHLVSLGGSDQVDQLADGMYNELQTKGIEVLYDDRSERPGAKFADSDLLGIPYRIVVSDRAIENNQFEVVTRKTGETNMISQNDLVEHIISLYDQE